MKIESGRMLNDYIEPNKKQYCIPVFQRDYAWTEEQCTKLFEDIVMAYKKDRPHFCGSFVYAPLGSKKHIDSYIIIDGQQRFTTLYILIKALADSADDDRDKEALQRYLYNEDKFNRYGLDEKSKLKLKPVKTDNDQLLLLMSGKIEQMDKSRRGIIYHNYMLFMQLIKSFLEESSANSVLMINDGIEKLICADIRLDTDDNAQEIFERINSTGIKLGLADLIRNYILMTDTDQERLYEEYWLTMQNLLPDKLLDNFFIDYLNMKSDGFVKESEAYKSFKQVYVEVKYDNEKMLQEILHYAKQYYVFCYGSSDFGAEVNKALAGLRKLKQTTVYLFLFRVFDDYENGIINKNELARVLKMLLSYSIRRLVCEIGSNTLRGLYKTLYGRVFEQKENKNTYYDSLVSFFLQQTSKNTIPSDNEFLTALQEKNLYSKNALCKYLLCEIENQGKETLDTENLSIEHIMPQNKNLSMSWQKMLGENWQSVHEKYLHTLGNLTLTGYNSELGDKPFEKKKEKLEETITHIAVLYSDVKDKSEWNSVNMEKRAKRLAEIILKLFPIEQPKTKIEFTDPHYKLYTLANPDDATYKTVNYFEFLGERVNVSSFAEMVRSIAQILYDMDNSIIDDMAKKHEPLPEWTTPAFSYEEDGVRNPFKLRNCNIYISTGYSASACIFFIRGLMKKYEFDISEDFVYSAKPNNTSIN
ncbi:DUF262 domain-containing protein [uncultured Phascolarctobacterium sp.]|uniref:DUF262 domain-containing protein n=1 Tax=uncultured Phascolarctobacterium sp. TaxID=512296 RepID=UPI0027DD9CF8|nr:DUF262 domain-containing protein [uncultured Phascolarctobacterium sp.]